MSSITLGWQLARRSWRESISRTASMALGMMLAGFVAAAILGLPAVFDGKDARRQALAVVPPAELLQADSSTTLDLDDWPLVGRQIQEQLGDRRLDRIVLSGTGELPPGVGELPQPGEVVLSPALEKLADSDPLVAQRFPQVRLGTITDSGLIDPGDLVAYVGAQPDERFFPTSFGTDERLFSSTRPAEVRIAMVLSAVFLALPAGAFLAISSRLSARARNQRLASLRLIGLSRRAVRTVNAVETAIVAAAGAALGCVLWALTQPAIGRQGVGGFRWFAADAPIRPSVALTIVVVATISAIAVATVTANDAVDEPMAASRQGTPTVRIVWRAAVLVFGLALLVFAAVKNSTDDAFFWALFVGGLASAIGTTLSTPVVSRALGTALGSRLPGTTRMLVARRLQHEPSAAGRVLTGVLVATFALGVGQGVIGSFQDASYSPSEDTIFGIDTNLEANQIAELPGVVSAIPQVEIKGGDSGWVATCAQLRLQLDQDLPTCIDGQEFELTFGGVEGSYGVPVIEAVFPPNTSSAISGLIVPPSQAELGPVQGWTVRADPALRDEFDAALIEADPVAFTGNWTSDDLADLVAAVITAGAIAAFTIGLASVAVATADRAIERRALDANLLAVGIPARFLRRAQLWAVSLPVAFTVTLAAGVGTLAGHVYRQAGSDIDLPFPWAVALLSTGVGLTGAALAGLLAYFLTQTRLAPGDLRTT